MVPLSDVVCPRCGEDRVTLISKIVDPLGERYYCDVCAFEFRAVVAAIVTALKVWGD